MLRKRSRVNNRLNQKIDAITTTTESITNPPDYLPYNAYKNLETMQEKKTQEDVHSQISALQPQEQPSLKQRKRHSKPIKISGDVDLGMSFNQKNQRRRQQKNKKTTTTTQQPNHHHHPNNALPEPEIVKEETTSNFENEEFTTDAPAPIEKSTMSEQKKKLEEKALRRERLKAKLAQLTPEERQAFLLMKQQRADARKKGLSFAKTS